MTSSPAVDGVSGEFRVAPVALETPRLRPGGGGTAGLQLSDDLSRPEHLALVRAGELASMHSWELVTGVDGPGTRMTVFLSGCPLRCLYCHNPDTMFAAKGQPVRLADLVGRLRRYRTIFRTTKGGLTISGGEPLMQPAFVGRLLGEAKQLGIHTALDTSGFLGANASDELLDDVDLVLLDIKSGIPETYRRTTGRDLAPTLEFARRLGSRGSEEVWIRFVLVPGLTDAVDNVEAVAEFVAGIPVVTRVEVLPFHQMGRDKWATMGLPYELSETSPPSQELVTRVKDQFRAHGLTAH